MALLVLVYFEVSEGDCRPENKWKSVRISESYMRIIGKSVKLHENPLQIHEENR